jgi:hypothetical protein
MKLQIDATNIRWWFGAITLVFILAALAGWFPGYYVVMLISGIQVLFFLAQEKSLSEPDSARLFRLHAVRILAGRAHSHLCDSSVRHLHGHHLRPLRHRPRLETDAVE